MKSFIVKLAKFFSGLFSRDFWSAVLAGIEAASPYLEVAYELVRVAAEMTPTRADDELFALADQLGVPRIWTSPDKGQAVREIVFAAAKWRLPSVPDRVINRAIELAYGALKP